MNAARSSASATGYVNRVNSPHNFLAVALLYVVSANHLRMEASPHCRLFNLRKVLLAR